MFPLWAFLAIGAAFLWAFTNVLDKYTISRLVKEPILPVIILGFMSLAIGAVILSQIPLGDIPLNDLAVMLFAGAGYTGMSYFYWKAIQQGEISRLIPLFYLSPLFILILSPFFIGVESLTLLNYLGIFLLVGGAILISMKNGIQLSFNKPFQCMILSTLSIAIAQVLTKFATQHFNFLTVFGFSRIGSGVAAVLLLSFHWNAFKQFVKKIPLFPIGILTLANIIDLVAIAIFTWALFSGPVSLTNALSAVQPLFVLLLTVSLSLFFPHILEENIQKRNVLTKLVAIFLIIGGSLLVI